MKVSLPQVTIAFPHLFTAQAPSAGEGEPKFNAQFIFPKTGPVIDAIRAAMAQEATAKWGANGAKVLASLDRKSICLRDGDMNLDKAGEVRDGFAGMAYLSASSKTRPTVVGPDRAPLVEADGKPYGGAIVNAIVDIYATEIPGVGKGVFAGLAGVQHWADGERLGGGTTPATADEFAAFGTAPAPAPAPSAAGFF